MKSCRHFVRMSFAGGAAGTLLLALATPVSAQAPKDPPPPQQLEAARNPAVVVDDAPRQALAPGLFVPVAEGPQAGVAGAPVVVDLRKIPESRVPQELVDRPRVHLQGQFGSQDPGTSSSVSLETPGRDAPPIEPVDTTQEQVMEGVKAAPATFVTRWDARGASGWIPPDTVMAVGPEYIVEAVNSGFMVYTKTGTETRAYTDFEGFVTLPTPWDGFCYDPRVVYSAEHQKFVMMIMGKDETNLTSYFWLMVSQSSNPNGSWWIYRFNASAGASGSEEWLDYASIAVDHWGTYVTGNYFLYGGGFQRVQLWSISPSLMEGATAYYYYWANLKWPNGDSAFTVQPAHPNTQNSATNTFFVNTYRSSGNQVCLWTLHGKRYESDPQPDAANLSRVAIGSKQYYAMYNNVDQPGSAWDIDAGDARVMNAVYSQGRVYGTLTLNWDGNRVYSEVYLMALNVAGSMAWDRAIWNSSYNMSYPAVAVEGSANPPDVYLTFSQTEPANPNGYIGMSSYIYDPTADSAAWLIERWGDGPYSRWDGDFVGDGRNRWGDYSGAGWDWSCNNVWGAAEYANATNNWGTRIAARTLGTHDPCQYFHVVSPNGGGYLTAGQTVTVSWEKMNIPSSDDIFVYLWDGANWHSQSGALSGTATAYSWKVPNIPSTNAQIFVGNWDTGLGDWAASDRSDGTFGITGVPDLTYSLLDPPSVARIGDSISVYNSLRNIGAVGSGSFTVELRLSTNTLCSTSDPLVGSRVIGSLTAGGINFDYTTASIPSDAMLGTNYLCMMIDRSGAINEFDETNNTVFQPIEITNVLFEDDFESGNTSAWSSSVP